MEMFEPQLTLTREKDGQYTMHALTLTPNTCYSAGRAQLAPPPEVLVAPEVQPVMLHLRARRGHCAQTVTPVRHRVRDLQLGDAYGKTSVSAFVMLDGSIVGSANVRVQEPGPCGGVSPGAVLTCDWYAWVNRMTPGAVALHVTCTVLAPHAGFDVHFRRTAPQATSPGDLLLDLQVDERPGSWPQVVTPIHARFEEPSVGAVYTGVLARIPGQNAVHVEVDEVF
jgi:hypothetical protein